MTGSRRIKTHNRHAAKLLSDRLAHWLIMASLITVACAAFSGCASFSQAPVLKEGRYRVLPLKYRNKALAYESKGQLRQALLSWRIVQSFSPLDKNIAQKTASLEKKTQARAAAHFQKGVELYHKRALRAARREFLETLIYEPEHTGALTYLMEKMQRPVFKTYKVKAGDTARKIAAKVYNDPDKEFLIADFNRINNARTKLPRGTTLRLVILGNNFLGKTLVVKNKTRKGAAKANQLTNGKKTARQQKARTGTGKQAANVRRNYVRYQKAKELLGREEFLAALELLRTIDSNYREVPKLIAFSKVYLKQEAYAHYQRGVSYYLAEKLNMAIQEWQAALRLRPNYLKAKQDLKHAKQLLQQLQKY